MIRVAIDATPLLGVPTGVARLVDGLLGALTGIDDVEVVGYAVTRRGRHRLAGMLPPGVAAATSPLPARLVRARWSRGRGPTIERWTGPVDVVHATNFVAPPIDHPTLVTVHDLTVVRFPELCTRDTLRYPHELRRAFEGGASVHTTTAFVGAEVVEHFGIDPARVVTVPPGVDADHPHGDAERGRALAGGDRYLLALGTVEPRKNFPTLARAFDRVAAEDPEARLVIAGPDGWGASELDDALAHVHHVERVTRLGFVSGQDRRALLAGARVFAYPSRYEGFGFPALEACAAQVPVLAARAGALPEVLGDAALFVDPDDVEGIAEGLVRLLDDEARRDALVRAGRSRVGRYSWERSARELAAWYRQAT